jgi:acetolactate synthase-1/3 small subunit
MKHTISVLTQNEAGALSRIVNLFSSRGYNIESLTVATTFDTKYARSTIVTRGDDAVIEQILKQLNRLIPVIKVADLNHETAISLELVLAKVIVKETDKPELLKLIENFGGKIINVDQKEYTIQAVCDERQLKSLIEVLKPFGIKEIVHSGAVSI